MNAKRVCAAAGVIFAAQQTRQTSAGIAAALESEQLLQSPETAAELDRLRTRVAELETFGLGCDAEGCVMPHSSWCERAQKHAAENDGCTCPKPWKGSPQPHAGYCWLLSPPRDEVQRLTRANLEAAERAQKVINDLQARVAELERERHTTNDALAEAHLALATKEPAEPASPAQQAAAEIQAMHDPTVIGYIVGVDWLSLTLRPRALADWQAWLDRLGADLAHVTHRGATTTAKGSWNGVPVSVQAHGVGALLAAARTTTRSGAV